MLEIFLDKGWFGCGGGEGATTEIYCKTNF
jgi:hypothetical protein